MDTTLEGDDSELDDESIEEASESPDSKSEVKRVVKRDDEELVRILINKVCKRTTKSSNAQ